MLTDLNNFIIGLLSHAPTIPEGTTPLICLWSFLIAAILIACNCVDYQSQEPSEEEEGAVGFVIVLMIIHLIFNVYYSFFATPDTFIWLTKIIIFIFPYFVVWLSLYYWYRKK